MKWAPLILLPIFFFLLYSSPLWKGEDFHPSLIENDALHYEDTIAFFQEGFSDFRKYGIGAHLLEWTAVSVMLNFYDEDAPGFDPVMHAPRLSAWYHSILAALSLLFIFSLLRTHLGNSASLLATVLLGLNPAMGFFAINAGVNVPFFFFLMGALFYLDQWGKKQTYGYALLTGVFSALAFVNKEYFGFLVLAFPVCLFLYSRKTKERKIRFQQWILQSLAGLAVFIIVVFGISLVWFDPGLYLQHLESFLSDDPNVMGPDRYDLWRSGPASLRSYLPNAIQGIFRTVRSIPIGLAAMAGIYLAIRRLKYRIWALLLPGAVYLLFIPLHYDLVYYPYLFPLLPTVVALAAFPTAYLWESRKKLLHVLAIIFALIATADMILHNIYFHHDMKKEPRLLVEQYFKSLPQNQTYGVVVVGRNLKSPDLDKISTIQFINEKDFYSPVDYVVISERVIEKKGDEENPCAFAEKNYIPSKFSLVQEFANKRRFWRLKINEFNQAYYICRMKN